MDRGGSVFLDNINGTATVMDTYTDVGGSTGARLPDSTAEPRSDASSGSGSGLASAAQAATVEAKSETVSASEQR